MIQPTYLTKRYDNTTVVEHLNLQIDSGEIVGIIGHNGAGKITTMKMIVGLVEPTSGQVQVMAQYSEGKHQSQTAHWVPAGRESSLRSHDRPAVSAIFL